MNAAVDIAVIGAGAAGIAAAVSAARAGSKTILLDLRPAAGGTGGFSGLTTLCGLYDSAGEFLNAGFTREFAEALAERRFPNRSVPEDSELAGLETGAPIKMGRVWVLPYRPEKFRAVVMNYLATTPNLNTRWNTPLTDVICEGRRIVSLNSLQVGAVIDCSGSAEVARAIGADCLATDETTQAPAILFPLINVTRKLDSPAAVAQALLPLARAGFPPLNFQASLEPGILTAKFTGRAEQVPALLDFLRQHVSGFENCATPLTKFTPVARAGRMIPGQYLLTGADVLAGRKFSGRASGFGVPPSGGSDAGPPEGGTPNPDSEAAARCAWPIEQWSADGAVRYKYLPPGAHYEIPPECLRAANVTNLFMAGKTISADVDAIASARVMGCCLATGAAAGVLAAEYLESPC